MTDKITNIGINGFGRIGRMAARKLAQRNDFRIVLINDPFLSPDYMDYLITYDSTHGKAPFPVSHDIDSITLNGKKTAISSAKSPGDIPWLTHKVDIVLECTGIYKTTEDCRKYLSPGMKCIISAPAADDTPTFVYGVNHKEYKPIYDVISNASCTTNCLAPLVKIIDEFCGIEEGLMTTIHSLTANQLTVDGPSKGGKDWRAGRCASTNIIPATTGAAKAVAQVYPKIKGKITGMAFRVPTVDVSVVDFTFRSSTSTSLDKIMTEFKAKSCEDYEDIISVTFDEVVSQDFVTDSRSSIVDAKSCIQLNDRFYKIVAWYDNEYGYASRLVDMCDVVAKTR